MSNDLDLLKGITESVAQSKEEDGRWEEAEEAVSAVLHVLYETAQSSPIWQLVYDAIKTAYGTTPGWSDDAERAAADV